MREISLAPIILFLYNRLKHTQDTIEALRKNDLAQQSDLYVFCDGPKKNANQDQIEKVLEVQSYADSIAGFKHVYVKKQPVNKGLANSVISGVSEVIEKYGKAIVVEDDIITHPFFLRFMNGALSFYEKDKRIFTIGGMMDKIDIPNSYKKDVLLSHRVESWGWATWADRWFTVEWDILKYSIWGKNQKKEIKQLCRGGDDLWGMLQMQNLNKTDSWAVRWQYNMSKQNKYCLRPVCSFVSNVGFDGSGVHCGTSETGTEKALTTALYNKTKYEIKLEEYLTENADINDAYMRLFAVHKDPLIVRLKVFVFNMFLILKNKLKLISFLHISKI